MKVGDKVKLRSWVTKQDLRAIDISLFNSQYLINQNFEITGFLREDSMYSNQDCNVETQIGTIQIPQAWLKAATGHPYTNIFKN